MAGGAADATVRETARSPQARSAGTTAGGKNGVLLVVSQACRGDQHDVPVLPLDAVDHGAGQPEANVTQVDAASVHTLPAGADFLMCYSVAEGGCACSTRLASLTRLLHVSPGWRRYFCCTRGLSLEVAVSGFVDHVAQGDLRNAE